MRPEPIATPTVTHSYLSADEHERPPGELGEHPVQPAAHRVDRQVAAEEEEHQDPLARDLTSLRFGSAQMNLMFETIIFILFPSLGKAP